MTEMIPGDNHARHAVHDTAISAAMQDYLKAIHRLQQGEDRVTTLNLASELGLSGPSVTNMMKRLADLSLVEHNRYRGVRLTTSGEKVALEVIRHHRLLELYLAEAMGFAWDKVHEEAERLEHHVSSELEMRMDELLGHPEFDPHGDPIPSRRGDIPPTSWVLLSNLPTGSKAYFRRVSDRDSEHLRLLSEINLMPGALVEVTSRGGAEDTFGVRVANRRHTIPTHLAASMQMEPVQ